MYSLARKVTKFNKSLSLETRNRSFFFQNYVNVKMKRKFNAKENSIVSEDCLNRRIQRFHTNVAFFF